MIYGNMEAQAKQSSFQDALVKPYDPTIEENINMRIARAEAQVEALKATKEKLKATGLLSLKISDLREAMNY